VTVTRATRRLLHVALSSTAVAAFVASANPRIVAWSESSNANLIATTRAASCLLANEPIQPNTIITDSKGRPLPPGRYICYWDGMTGQTTQGGAVGYLKPGQPEQIASILESRGFKKE
jgi:hypothetical protein